MKDRQQQRLPWYVFATTIPTLILSLAVTAFMVYLSIDYASRTSAYDSAQRCQSAREIAHCRFEASVLVVAKRHVNPDVLVDLVFTDVPGKAFTAYFPQEKESSLPHMQQGSAVDGELWLGNVTMVAGAKTLDNPDTLPTSGPPVATFFGFVTLVVVALLIYFVSVNHRARVGKMTGYQRWVVGRSFRNANRDFTVMGPTITLSGVMHHNLWE